MTCHVYSCVNCNFADIILQPYWMESSFIAQYLHEVVVAGSITLEVLIGIVPAVLTPILLHENVLVDLQNVLGQFPRPVSRGQGSNHQACCIISNQTAT